MAKEINLREVRCISCGALLYKADAKVNSSVVIEKKCKCGVINVLEIKPDGRTFEERLNLVKK